MEILRSDPKEELAVIEEDDEFYEEIEAPKFVDFTVPDRSRPDDKSWFCLRIGCDQQHEEVNPDALYRSFMLRVMAARSPNVKLQKALNRQVPRSIKKCPRSAPAKSVKDRVSRLSTMTSIPDKMANTRLKHHPVSSLRSTPNNIKAKLQPLTSEKKALTTPRTRKCPINPEPFRSVKHQKAPAAVLPKSRSVAKALFLGTPKKNDEASSLLNSEVCDGMKKLNIGIQKKHTPEGRLCKSSRCEACDPNLSEVSGKKGEAEAFSMSSKKRNKPREADISSTSSDHGVVKTNVEESLPTSAKTDSTSSEENLKENIGVLQDTNEPDTKVGVVDNVAETDDNKENDSSARDVNSSTTNSESDSLQFETSENIPPKEIKAPSKKIQEHSNQAGHVKRTTILKPFRLRTDERGILKQTNLEKKVQLEAQKETVPIINRGDGKQQTGKTIHEKNHQTSSNGGHKTQPNKTRSRVRFVESRYATSINKCHKSENKDTEELEKTIVKKTVSSKQILKAQSEATTASKVQVSQLREKATLSTKARVEDNNMANATCLKGKRHSAMPKVSTCRGFHAPKSCTRRQEATTP